MRSTQVHNVVDYVMALVLIACPFLSGMARVPAALTTFIAASLTVVFYSLLTDYAISARRLIPFFFHRALDLMVGLFVLIAPGLYDYRYQLTVGQYLLHIALGLATIAMAVLTRTDRHRLAAHRPLKDEIDRAA